MGFEHVIPELMRKLRAASGDFTQSACTLDIQGTGQETRAFCFVEDAVDQIVLVQDAGADGEIYHIGRDTERRILDLIADMGRVLGIDITVNTGELRSGGTTRRCPSIDKVRALGYAGDDHYQDGLRETVFDYKKRLQDLSE